MKDNLTRFITKITSARFLIVVILTVVFAICTIRQILTTEFLTIYTMIITYYFTRDREINNNKGDF